MDEGNKDVSLRHEAISRRADPWEIRSARIDALLLAAVKEALPQGNITSVRLAYRYPRCNLSVQDLPPGCVQVEIIRP
jgi:hypothetical protein